MSAPILSAAAFVAASLLIACGSPDPPPAPIEEVGGNEPDEATPRPTPLPTATDSWAADDGSTAPRDAVRTGRAAPKTKLPDDAVDIILITVDTWRADRLGAYGSPRSSTSTNLADWARAGVLFDSAWAPSSWTWPTLSSIATGLYPSAHGAVTQSSSLCDAPQTLAETLHASGRRTGFAGSNGYLEPPDPEPRDSGFGQGFEYYWARGLEAGPRVIEFADHFLQGIPDDPAFLHVHLFDPHCPYDASEEEVAALASAPFGPPDGALDALATFPDAVRVSGACHFVPIVPRGLPDREIAEMEPGTDLQAYLDAYDAGLAITDRLLGDLADVLAKHGRWRESWVIVTGDHGEEFGEHGRLGHGKSLYAETARVPLLIRPPLDDVGWARGARVETPVSLVDLPPTVAALIGLPPHASWQGRDLSEAVRGNPLQPVPILSETDYETTARLFIDGGFALHRDLDSGRRVYDLSSDPNMTNPRSPKSDPVDKAAPSVALLEASLGAEERRIAGGRMCQAAARAMTPAQLENLKALGYVGESSTPSPD